MNRLEIKGKEKKGKNILILTGVHGDELTPIYCGLLLRNYGFSDMKKNFKKITILNAINIEGIKKNIREIPNINTDDLNRMFSNDYDGDLSEIIAEEINKHDIIIDIHSSPRCTEMILINQNEYANSYVDFIKSIDASYLLRYSSNNTIKRYCQDLGKISFTIELNGMGKIDYESSHKGFNVVLEIIKNNININLVKEEPKYDSYFEFTTYKEGLFIPIVKLGDFIKNGDCLGHVLDLKTFDMNMIIYNKKDARLMLFDDIQYVSGSRPICYLQA